MLAIRMMLIEGYRSIMSFQIKVIHPNIDPFLFFIPMHIGRGAKEGQAANNSLMFYIYILYSPGADKYYVGHTDDVDRRLQEHNELSDQSYTSKYRPWELKISLPIGVDRGLALKIEKHIKRQKSRIYIEDLIERGSIDGLLSRFNAHG
jgi:putative endonuclease